MSNIPAEPRIAHIPSNLFYKPEWQTVDKDGNYELVSVIEYSAFTELQKERDELKLKFEKHIGGDCEAEIDKLAAELQAAQAENAALLNDNKTMVNALANDGRFQEDIDAVDKLTKQNQILTTALQFYARPGKAEWEGTGARQALADAEALEGVTK